MSSPDPRYPDHDDARAYHETPRASPTPAGDAQSYFARARVRWLRRCLDELGDRPTSVLVFGCGAGTTTRYFFEEMNVRSLVGVDVSREKLAIAERARSHAAASYVQLAEYRATESMDLAYATGVFSHLGSLERTAGAVLVFRSLKSGGLFAFWENNPWHPGARPSQGRDESNGGTAMSPLQARQLLRGAGFDIVHTTSAFYFPRSLHWARPIETLLAPIPLGGEYMVLARKP